MAGIGDIFEIGRSGLQAHQQGIAVASHNINNANTKGFSRQEAILEAGRPVGGVFPTGVRVTEIKRHVDQFIEAQLTDTVQDLGRLTIRHQLLQQVEPVFAETSTLGINNAMNRLFDAFRDLSTFPEDSSVRTVVLNEGTNLADTFNSSAKSLRQIRSDIDAAIGRNLTEVNSLATQIASLNAQIQTGEASGENANDLRDKRAVTINDMAKLVSIATVEMTDGVAINVGGQLLVSGNRSNSLVQVADTDNAGMNDVALKRSDGSTLVITSKITDGEIKGQLTVRDTDVVGYQDRLDRLAAQLIVQINTQHEAGFGLDGTTTNSLFSALSPDAPVVSDANAGGVVGTSTSVLTASSLTMDNYKITFTSTTLFDVTNLTDGTTVLSGQTYSSGGNIDFDGLRVVLTNGSSGPASGDVFTVDGHTGAASDMARSLTDTNKVAASSTAGGVPGNNVNALALVAIQTTTQANLGTVTLNDYHAATAGNVGSDTALASLQKDAKQVENDQVKALRESVSGVSLDEELTRLLSFQRAFEASARLILVADELYQTVLTLGR